MEYVHDSRNGRVQGPFEPGEGKILAQSLNEYVAANMLAAIGLLASEIRGPFYVYPDKERRF